MHSSHSPEKTGSKQKIPEIEIFHSTTTTYFKKNIIEKIATSLHNVNVFSNKHILTKSFADSQFTSPSPYIGSKQKIPEIEIFHNTTTTYFKKKIIEKIATSLHNYNFFQINTF